MGFSIKIISIEDKKSKKERQTGRELSEKLFPKIMHLNNFPQKNSYHNN